MSALNETRWVDFRNIPMDIISYIKLQKNKTNGVYLNKKSLILEI